MAKEKFNQSLEYMRKQVKDYIEENYNTVEEFCWDNDLNKATVSNFLTNKKDFQISTLEKIAAALDGVLDVKIK